MYAKSRKKKLEKKKKKKKEKEKWRNERSKTIFFRLPGSGSPI
jgi:hypothetical protein